MHKIIKLKTLEQFRLEFGVYIRNEGYLEFDHDRFHWVLNNRMVKKLGGYLKVKKLNGSKIEGNLLNYTHAGEDGWLYHELWFEPEFEDFLKEEEMVF